MYLDGVGYATQDVSHNESGVITYDSENVLTTLNPTMDGAAA